MRKKLTSNDLQRDITRSLLAGSLMAALAVFGCSTNRTPGNGEPYTGGPSWGQTSPSSTPGSSSGTTGTPPSMTSSSSLSTNDAALAILAEHQLQPRVLGPASPDGGKGIVSTSPTGQWVNPALLLNPEVTVNSSATSYPTPAIISGAGDGVAGGVATDSAAIIGTTATTGVATPTPATAATTLSPGALAAGPSVATSSAPATATNGATLTPTVSSGAVSNATVAASPLVNMTSSSTLGNARTTATTATGTTATSSQTVAPVRVLRSANGSITITNVH